MSVLKQSDAAVQLIEAVRNHAFPIKELEAKELYRMGTSSSGILSRQAGERMTSYMSRRHRWWKKLQSLDESIPVSETIRANYFSKELIISNLDRKEKFMILTAVNDKPTIENVESTLGRQHNKIHVYEKKTKKENGFKQTSKPFYKKPFASGKSKAYLAGEDFIEVDPDEGDDLSNENADDGDVACLAADIGEAEDVELVELDVVAAFLGSDTFDDIGDSQSHSSLNEATAYLGCVKGKGKGIPMRKGGTHGYRPRVSHLSIEDGRRKLQEIKARSTCKKCGKKGHWAGDRECTAPTGTHQKSKGDRKKVGHLAVVESGLHDAACQTECSPSSSSKLGASPTPHFNAPTFSLPDAASRNHVAYMGVLDHLSGGAQDKHDDIPDFSTELEIMSDPDVNMPDEPPDGHDDNRFTFGQHKDMT